MYYAPYILVLAVPLAGIAAQFARGEALPVLALAPMHVAAAPFHHFVLRDRTLEQMLPGC